MPIHTRHTRHTAAMLFALLALFAGCAKQEPPQPSVPDVPFSAAVSAFQQLVPRSKKDSTFVNCLEINGKDPPSAVLAALLASGREVVPASECTYVLDTSGSFHNQTKKRAMFHRLKDFARYGNVAAELYGSSYVHGLFGTALLINLAYRDGQWHVVGVELLGVS